MDEELYNLIGALRINRKGTTDGGVNSTLEYIIPESRRPDGSIRKAVPIRKGFLPEECIPRYRPPFKRDVAAKPPTNPKLIKESHAIKNENFGNRRNPKSVPPKGPKKPPAASVKLSNRNPFLTAKLPKESSKTHKSTACKAIKTEK
ncbi:bifunctional WIBG [Babesia duncani]|uniref:Bifunctional WIBG n=1 Tax=Babesia duncani TaxID=323732 RepID=A0AAD9PJC4_9APIC|nr:bifunctional WIBG [Babesia duncani]